MKYRKKPIVIEAMQLTRKLADVVCDFVGSENIEEFNTGEFAKDCCFIDIKTLEGVMTASEGDYIIKGVAGEFYPCRADIFNATYEAVDE